MTSVHIDRQALDFGFRLVEVQMGGVTVWLWQRGRHHSPPFLNEDAARSWMAESLRRASLFND
jgi:hypothetical protein